MQPTTQTKPVMDIAAPKSSAPALNPFTQAPAAASTPAPAPAPTPKPAGELPVRPAPLAESTTKSEESSSPETKERQAEAKRPGNAPVGPRKPVALITVTVFVMLVLSALAVTVYVTSQTA